MKREQELGERSRNHSDINENNVSRKALTRFRKLSVDLRNENERMDNSNNNNNNNDMANNEKSKIKNQSNNHLLSSFDTTPQSTSHNSDKFELLKQLSKNSANIQINEKINKNIKNLKRPILHLANNAKDKWLLMLCRVKGGIENLPKIFLASLDMNSLFTNINFSNDDDTTTTPVKSSTKNLYKKLSVNQDKNIVNKLETNKIIKSSDFSINDDHSYRQQSNFSLNLMHNKLINSLAEIRYELKKDVDCLNNKMQKVDEKILFLIQNYSYKPDNNNNNNKESLSPNTERTSLELDSYSVNQFSSGYTINKTLQSNRNGETIVNNNNNSLVTTYNEINRKMLQKSTTNTGDVELNKLEATNKIKKSKSHDQPNTTIKKESPFKKLLELDVQSKIYDKDDEYKFTRKNLEDADLDIL